MGKIVISRRHLAIPYIIYLFCFVVAPAAVLMYYAFTGKDGEFTFDNFVYFFTQKNTVGTLVYSLCIAVVTTFVCIVIAYPVAYILAKSDIKRKSTLLLVFVMPMWINFTLRITALKEILTIFEHNLSYYPFFNSVIGMTYDFLPFMILPLYNTIRGIDNNLLEAARDLGAKPLQILERVLLPLSMPGIISGVIMVFLPSMTNYVVLDMLYNSTYIMGSLIGSYFSAYDWHNGSMIAIILLVIILIITAVAAMIGDRHSDSREAVL